MSKPTNFAVSLDKFFTVYLPGHRNLSSNTIRSYADTFSLFVDYCDEQLNIPPEKLTLDRIKMESVESFMSWLETERGNAPSTRRQRLAALHSFFWFMQKAEPLRMVEWQRILALKLPKSPKKQPTHIRGDTMRELLAAPDENTPQGRRDRAILCLLYDSGARVQELIDLSVRDIRISHPATVTLMGKGRKMRIVPILDITADILEQYIADNQLNENGKATHPLFFNRQGNRLTRAGVNYIIHKYLDSVSDSVLPDKVTPHIFRHTKAMHLLQSGVDVIMIRDLLGHTDVKTTEVYARADTEMKRQALQMRQQQSIIPSTSNNAAPSWHTNSELRSWLKDMRSTK
jgi:site-specific recombinase XerD